MTEQTHPQAFRHDEAFGHDEARDALSSDADAAGSAAPAIRRRGPLVTRWIGFSAQRRRARERSNRLQDLHHGASEARSNS